MGFPKDIINIVISMKKKDEKKRLNRNYYDKYEIQDSIKHRYGICLINRDKDKYGMYAINYRNIAIGNYRKEIVCFLTKRKTKYCVPKNY